MKVFLSHASQDRLIAEEISLALRGAGFEVFFDESDLPPGGDYHSRIREAVEESAWFVFLISPESVAAGRYTLSELEFAKAKWPHPQDKVLPVMVQRTAYEIIPAYLKAVSILEPKGNQPAEVTAALKNLTSRAAAGESSPDDRIFRAADGALQALHDLDNAIRKALGPLTRFDAAWSSERREAAISAIDTLADAEEILPRVRQSLAQLTAEVSKPIVLAPERRQSVDEVLACGRAALEALGRSHVTPWPGPHELVMLIGAIRTSTTPDAARSVIQGAESVQAVVNRDRLGAADVLIGRWRGGMKAGGVDRPWEKE